MADVLLLLLAVMVTWVLVAAGVGWYALRRARRGNRVSASVPSPTPVWWRWSPSGAALLHRRLQAATFPIDPSRSGGDLVAAVGTDELRVDLLVAAVQTDAALADLRRAPARYRRHERARLARRVANIEDVAARLCERPTPVPPVRTLVSRTSASPEPDLAALVDRIQHLEAGRAEVRRWTGDEQRVG